MNLVLMPINSARGSRSQSAIESIARATDILCVVTTSGYHPTTEGVPHTSVKVAFLVVASSALG
jgi:hypothetical protein